MGLSRGLLCLCVLGAIVVSCAESSDTQPEKTDVSTPPDAVSNAIDVGSQTTDTNQPSTDEKQSVQPLVIRACQEGDAGACEDVSELDFGTIPAGEGRALTLQVSNDSDITVDLVPLQITAEGFSLEFDTEDAVQPTTLDASSSFRVTVSVLKETPPGPLPTDTLVITATATDREPVKIELPIVGTVQECQEGTGNCDSNWGTGCETQILSSVEHCGQCGATCTAENGTAECKEGLCVTTCSAGWTGPKCDQNIDECAAEPSPCHTNATCTDQPGTHSCQCNSGYAGDGIACEQIQCPENATGAPACQCESGHSGTLNWDSQNGAYGGECTAVACPENATNHPQCQCLPGFSGELSWDSETQTYSNECATVSCPENAENHPECACLAGFEGTLSWNGETSNYDGACNDIDECAVEDSNDCSELATCTNTPGGYECVCGTGYLGDGKVCVDTNECADPELNNCDPNATCENAKGSFNCTCNNGYDGNGTVCKDVDECSDKALNTCDPNATCKNTEGSFTCTCNKGYADQDNTCTDINECQNDPCGKNATCTNSAGSYSCACNKGYLGDGISCKDVDECKSLLPCSVDATCTNTDGSFQCVCNSGYQGDGISCKDVNECNDNPCSSNAKCTNSVGSYTCTCKTGYNDNGKACEDVDECLQDPCDTHAACTNTLGGYNCECNKGFKGDGHQCKDVNECQKLAPCPINSQCTNLLGSYDCNCKAGFFANGDQCQDVNECLDKPCDPNATCDNKPGSYICNCNMGYIGDGTTCQDYDECVGENPCHKDAICSSKNGKPTCECKPGYAGNGYTCSDINECGKNPCSKDSVCVNSPGGYTCKCKAGFEDVGGQCKDINECWAIPCTENAMCTNTPGSYECTCLPGFIDLGTKCIDNDECAEVPAPCDTNATCTNKSGSYLCECNDGFTGDGTTCGELNECEQPVGPCAKKAKCTDLPAKQGKYECECLSGYAGDGKVCKDINECESNNGGCDPLQVCTNIEGAPRTCSACPVGYKTTTQNACIACDKNYYGPKCQPCPIGTGGKACNGVGPCDDGPKGDGTCIEATCVDQNKDGKCDCPENKMGSLCKTDMKFVANKVKIAAQHARAAYGPDEQSLSEVGYSHTSVTEIKVQEKTGGKVVMGYVYQYNKGNSLVVSFKGTDSLEEVGFGPDLTLYNLKKALGLDSGTTKISNILIKGFVEFVVESYQTRYLDGRKKLMDAFQKHLNGLPNSKEAQILVTGHSAGTIYSAFFLLDIAGNLNMNSTNVHYVGFAPCPMGNSTLGLKWNQVTSKIQKQTFITKNEEGTKDAITSMYLDKTYLVAPKYIPSAGQTPINDRFNTAWLHFMQVYQMVLGVKTEITKINAAYLQYDKCNHAGCYCNMKVSYDLSKVDVKDLDTIMANEHFYRWKYFRNEPCSCYSDKLLGICKLTFPSYCTDPIKNGVCNNKDDCYQKSNCTGKTMAQ